ncbi:DUF3805 domain-containing protein [Bacteroides sp. 519]|uniref:DUF3805 domain-containing protein n=1 Tax=Bacteroides sp. 519 TaxID=2302937 RepID=UPI00351A92D0
MSGKKFISPGAWFSLVYPLDWGEFEDTESSFLFYNPNVWSGNFRISAFKKDAGLRDAAFFGKESINAELKGNPSASLVRIGNLECAYSKEMFQEDNVFYVNHLWITGIDNVAFECSFTVPKGGKITEAETIISALEIRKDGEKYPAEIIPIRVSEISEVDEGYNLTASLVKQMQKKDFQGIEEDLSKIQQIIDSDSIKPKQKDTWLALGIAVCVILTNEIEGFEWMTLIDGNREAPILQYTKNGTTIDPMKLVWSKVKAGNSVNVTEEYKTIIGLVASS